AGAYSWLWDFLAGGPLQAGPAAGGRLCASLGTFSCSPVGRSLDCPGGAQHQFSGDALSVAIRGQTGPGGNPALRMKRLIHRAIGSSGHWAIEPLNGESAPAERCACTNQGKRKDYRMPTQPEQLRARTKQFAIPSYGTARAGGRSGKVQ